MEKTGKELAERVSSLFDIPEKKQPAAAGSSITSFTYEPRNFGDESSGKPAKKVFITLYFFVFPLFNRNNAINSYYLFCSNFIYFITFSLYFLGILRKYISNRTIHKV